MPYAYSFQVVRWKFTHILLFFVLANFYGGIRVECDTREHYSPGWKFNQYEVCFPIIIITVIDPPRSNYTPYSSAVPFSASNLAQKMLRTASSPPSAATRAKRAPFKFRTGWHRTSKRYLTRCSAKCSSGPAIHTANTSSTLASGPTLVPSSTPRTSFGCPIAGMVTALKR